MRNVARTWAYETGCLVGDEMSQNLPYNDYYEYYGPDYELDVRPSNMDNANSKEYLEKILRTVLDNLRKTEHAPSVQMTDIPPSLAMNDDDEAALDDEDEDMNADKRLTQRQFDQRRQKDGDDSESEDEEIAQRNGVRRQSGRKRRQIIDHRNLHDTVDSEMNSAVGTPQAGTPQPEDADDMNVDTPNNQGGATAGDTGDVSMAEADAASVADSTKAEAPDQSAATTTTTAPITAEEAIKIKKEMAADDTAAIAQAEGVQEREEANAEGEARTEAAKGN